MLMLTLECVGAVFVRQLEHQNLDTFKQSIELPSYVDNSLGDQLTKSNTKKANRQIRQTLSEVNNNNIHGYVIGEHGDSEVTTWSNARIGSEEFDSYAKRKDLEWDDEIKSVIENDVKNAAYEIISRKNATYFAIGLAVNRIVEAIFRDENTILTVSSLFEGQYGIKDMYLAVPTIVNRHGAKEVLEIPIAKVEEEKLKKSADILKGHLDKCNI